MSTILNAIQNIGNVSVVSQYNLGELNKHSMHACMYLHSLRQLHELSPKRNLMITLSNAHEQILQRHISAID